MAEHSLSPSRSINLRVVESLLMIERHLILGVQDEHGHQFSNAQILNQYIK